MNPVFGVLLSALLLGEGAGTSPVTVIVALLLVCSGIIIVNKPKSLANCPYLAERFTYFSLMEYIGELKATTHASVRPFF